MNRIIPVRPHPSSTFQFRQPLQSMFAKFLRPLWSKLTTPRTLLTATVLTYSLFKTQLLLDTEYTEPLSLAQEDIQNKNFNDYIKQLRTVDVCEGKLMVQGQRKVVTVVDHKGVERKIMVLRMQGKLYAILASCPHEQPFEPSGSQSSLEKSPIFNDKLYCPHHGCVFDIKSGSIEHGPALNNLPIFHAQQTNGMVQLTYPLAVPTSISPDATQRDIEDLRKAVILGEDDAATIGCVNALRQFGYQGEITIAKEGEIGYPYRKEYLHKKMVNLHLEAPDTMQRVEENEKKTSDSKQLAKLKKMTLEERLNRYIEDQLHENVYSKLLYYDQKWYEYFGVDFVFNDEPYRIINKQYYPYITFSDGTKLQYDALLVATGLVPKIPSFEGVTTDQEKDDRVNLPENVFCPLRSKQQHIRLNAFLNKNKVGSLLVLGYNMESLEFVQAVKQAFPDIKLTVIDNQPNSSLTEFIGPDLEKAIAKEFTSRGVDFFIKVRDELLFSNKFSRNNIERRLFDDQIKKNEEEEANSAKNEATPVKKEASPAKKEDKGNKQKGKVKSASSKTNSSEAESKATQLAVSYPKTKYKQSVTVRIADDIRVKADGVVIFPNAFAGNNKWVRNGKYTDFDYYHSDRLGGDTFNRTDNIRIFTAGLCSANQYFLLGKRLVSSDATTAYEQGFNVGLNMHALRIPFTYIPFEKFQVFDKKFLYVGTRDYFDSVLIMGSVEDWDFLAVYALGPQVKGVSGSPSKGRQMAIIRQALRVNCMPTFNDLVSGYWSIENLSKLIRKLNKSGCYRDIIFENRENIHMKDLVWMQRTADAGFENDRPQNSEDQPSEEVDADGKLQDL